ncbi:GDP-mannose 4,6-dehydratase [Paenibacillus sp. PL91]|uniref:GDP-mannose 4,6-dehydratase n=1 Tax=Paenibacillus sp. PL91 TaxID=2729538 RepID=UPI00145F33DE|nr:GDP-mannose 4,6-dehydratase [Paenibacillus sp. PL91]MBC9200440.1 GDP-mannose 4,6-dehydratase [Paenibacillus sp. PL91]
MRALITGITGFVGGYLADYLTSLGYEVWGATRMSSLDLNDTRLNLVTIDFNDEDCIVETINQIKPDHIYHLAGQSSVKLSWEDIQGTFEANVSKTIALLEAIRKSNVAKSVRILTVGSSEEYGKVSDFENPINEEETLHPISPYGLSKATVYMLAQQYARAHQLHIVHARPFNHIGPGQALGFVTSDFAYQIAQIEKGIVPPIINVGNLDAQRDFSDVRDIVVAYEKLLSDGNKGEVYNVCSGKPIAIKEILKKYVEASICDSIEIQEDPSRMRPSDLPLYIGNPAKIIRSTNWENQIDLDQSLINILNYWRSEINSSKES